MCAISSCFRLEAEGAKKNNEMHRLRQFKKIEMFALLNSPAREASALGSSDNRQVEVKSSDKIEKQLEFFINIQKEILSKLLTNYRYFLLLLFNNVEFTDKINFSIYKNQL